MKSCPNKQKTTFGIAGCTRDWFFFPCDLRELSVSRSRQRECKEEEPKPCRSPVGALWRGGGRSLGILLIEGRCVTTGPSECRYIGAGTREWVIPVDRPILTPHEIKNHNTQMTITFLLSHSPGRRLMRVRL